jgi:phosphonopyruvate decarboxylase
MLTPGWLLAQFDGHRGPRVLAGVPCSYVSGLYSELEGDPRYIPATIEGEAVAMAAGAWLAGSWGVALGQNSGLGNMVNPLTSLIEPYRIPLLLGISRRGWPAGTDEPQHRLTGRNTPELIRACGLEPETLRSEPAEAAGQLSAALARIEARQPSALVIEKNVIGPGSDPVPPCPAESEPAVAARPLAVRAGRTPTRTEVIAEVRRVTGDRVTVASTGYTGRELYALDDRPASFYMAGSMGYAAAIGMGIALTSGAPVTVLDGDAALLMHLGILVNVGRHVRTPFLHVLLDNGVHESTGGQRAAGDGLDFAALALHCGYRAAWSCHGTDAIVQALSQALSVADGPVFVHCHIRRGYPDRLPRLAEPLPDLAQRLRDCLTAQPGPASVKPSVPVARGGTR